jgi:hypothetical protein
MKPFIFFGAMIDDNPVFDGNDGFGIVCRRNMALIVVKGNPKGS